MVWRCSCASIYLKLMGTSEKGGQIFSHLKLRWAAPSYVDDKQIVGKLPLHQIPNSLWTIGFHKEESTQAPRRLMSSLILSKDRMGNRIVSPIARNWKVLLQQLFFSRDLKAGWPCNKLQLYLRLNSPVLEAIALRILDISWAVELIHQNTEWGICAGSRTVLMLSAGGGVKEYPKSFAWNSFIINDVASNL